MDDQIKPVAWACAQDWVQFQEDRNECRLFPNFYWGDDLDLADDPDFAPLYDQQAIDTLMAEVERLRNMALMQAARADAAEREARHHAARAERAEAEADALRKDAERYRWLRAIDDDAPPGSDGYPVLTQWKHVVSDRQRGTLLFGADLDAAINAAKQAAE